MRRLSQRSLLSAIGLCVSLLLLAFVLTNSTNHVKDAPCDCPKAIKTDASNSQKLPAVVPPKFKQLPTKTTLPPLPACKLLGLGAPVQRAILIYYPHHQFDYFFPEIRWLYRSWAEMLHSQPPTWRTDFLIFTYNFSAEFRSLGCVNRIRLTKDEPSMCRLFLYIPIKFRTKNLTENHFRHAFDDAKRIGKIFNDDVDHMVTIPMVNDTKTFDANRSQSLFDNLRTYGYVDSINSVYEGFNTFSMYDFVLRTDIDVFIFRHFGNYTPPNCTLMTGGGGYGTNFNRRKLKRIARDMNFSYADLSGMGSTWYGSAYDGFQVADRTLDGMLWLALYEFATPERESKLGTLMWPEWHYGVLLLYGQHLGINHLVGQNKIRIIIGHDRLDQSSTNKDPAYLRTGARLNFHCWHTNERFSKFAFKLGQYNRSELETYRNDTTAQAYSMRMALESKYMTLEQLASLVKNSSSTA